MKIRARNTNGPGPWTAQLYILDESDNQHPVISDLPDNGALELSVAENTSPSLSPLHTFAATDGNGDDITWSVEGTDAAFFAIDDSGKLSWSSPCTTYFDYETQPSYALKVRAADAKSAVILDVNVTVTDVANEPPAAPPSFASATMNRYLGSSGLDAGSAIGPRVTAGDGDLRYALDATSETTFDIDCFTGQLSVDAGSPLVPATDLPATLTVTATDADGTTDTTEVTVVGVLDTPTVMRNLKLTPDPSGLSYAIDYRADWPFHHGDSALTGVNIHVITPNVDSIQATTGILDRPFIWTLSANWDRVDLVAGEKTSMRLQAVNGDVDGPWTAAVEILNDKSGKHHPVISNKPDTGPFEFSVEETAGGAVLHTFAATDGDGDTITWSVEGTGAASFTIDSSGDLSPACGGAYLDYASTPSYALKVRASDGWGAEIADVNVTVTDVAEAGSVSFDSSAPQVDTALAASLTDEDNAAISGATWQWATATGCTGTWTDIAAGTSASYTPAAADAGKYLRATASFTSGGSTVTASQITASAVLAAPGSNNAPVITNKVAGATVSAPENVDDHTTVLFTYTVTDADHTIHWWKLFSSDGEGGANKDHENFVMGVNGGGLFLRAAFIASGGLDYETKTSYTFTVEVSDLTDTDTVVVTLNVTNVDEAGSVSFDSTTPVVGTALTASLTDPDGSISGATWQWATSADRSTGWTDISGETSASYTPVAGDAGKYLRATASYTDGHGASKTAVMVAAHAVVAHTVVAHSPPGAPTNLLLIPSEAGRFHVQIDFAHPSSHGSATITYYEVDYNQTAVTESTTPPLDGERDGYDLYTAGRPSTTRTRLTAGAIFKVRMRACNEWVDADDLCTTAGTGPWSYTIQVIVDDEGNQHPVISSKPDGTGPFEITVSENTGSILHTFTATDGNGDTIIWSLEGTDAGSFTIDGSGQLTRASGTLLDYRTKPRYSFRVKASDSRRGAEIVDVNLTVTVTDVDERLGNPVDEQLSNLDLQLTFGPRLEGPYDGGYYRAWWDNQPVPPGIYIYIEKGRPIHQLLRAENVSRHRTHTATRPVATGDKELASRYVAGAGPVQPGETWCFSIGIRVNGHWDWRDPSYGVPMKFWSPETCITEPGEIRRPVEVPNVTGTVTTVYQYDNEGNKTGQTSYVACLPGDAGCEGRVTVYADRLTAYQWNSAAAKAVRRGETTVGVWTYNENGKMIGRTEYTGCTPTKGDELECTGELLTRTEEDGTRLKDDGNSQSAGSPSEDKGNPSEDKGNSSEDKGNPPEDKSNPPEDKSNQNSNRKCTAAARAEGHPDHDYCSDPQ